MLVCCLFKYCQSLSINGKEPTKLLIIAFSMIRLDIMNDIDFGSFDAYSRLVDYIERLLICIGLNVWDPNYKWGFQTVFMYSCMLSSVSFITYGLYDMRHDPYELLKILSVFGIPIKEVTIGTTLLYYATDIKFMHMQLLVLHRNCRGIWSQKLLQWVKSMDWLVKFLMCPYAGACSFMIFFPLFYYLVTGEKMLLFTMRIPFLDPNTNAGFLWYCAYQLLCAITTLMITFTGDAVFLLLCFSSAAYLELVRLKCEQLSERLQRSQLQPEQNDAKEITRMLLSTVHAGINADEFVQRLCKVYNAGFLVIIFCSGLSLATCVLAGKMTTWIIAYPLGFSLFFGIMMFSFIGTVLETKSEELSVAVYDIDWYLLSPADRRTLLMMFRYTQKIACITMMGSTRLNVETGMAIMKTIYSAYMMLEGEL